MPVPTTLEVTDPTQWGFHARLGSNLLRLATTPDRQLVVRRSVAQQPSVNTASNPEDFTDTFGRAFSQVDFSGGAGLRYAHRRANPENSNTLFYDSYGVRVDAEGRVCLLNDTEIVDSVGGGLTTNLRAAFNGTALYWSSDSPDLVEATGLTAGTVTLGTEVTGLTNDVDDVVSLGGTLYACDGAEIRDDAGGWANWSALAATRLWAVKNRILAVAGTTLYEDPDGAGPFTGDALATLRGGSTWNDVADAGEFVLASASDGYVYAFGFDGTSLALAAQSTFEQETPCAVAALHGRIGVLTRQQQDDGTFTKRLWVGSIDSAGSLVDMQVVKEWEGLDGSQTPCVLAAPERDSFYTAVYEGSDSHLWRYDIGTGAVTRDLIHEGVSEATVEIIKAEGRMWAFGREGTVTRELDSLRSSGYVVGSMVDFFTADNKVWDAVKVDGEFNGGTIAVSVSTSTKAVDNADTDTYWTAVKTVTNNDDTYTPVSLAPSRYLTTRLTLSGDVCLVSYVARAMPPVSDEELIFHINVSDDLTRPGRAPVKVRGYGDDVWASVRELQGDSLELEVYPLGIVWRGTLVDVQTPVQSLLARGGVTRTMQVSFRGREVEATTTTSGPFGSYGWGGALFGGMA